jgi:hypothetical protein
MATDLSPRIPSVLVTLAHAVLADPDDLVAARVLAQAVIDLSELAQ